MKKAVTISDIAKEVGVAPQVVSRVLHGGKSTASARKEIREQIKEVAAKRGYRPYAAGQMLRKGTFKSVGILIGHADNFLLSQLTLAGLAEGLAEKEYTATLFHAKGQSDSALLDSRLITSKLTDALIIPYIRKPSRRLISELKSLHIPVIWMNRRSRHDALHMNEAGAAEMLFNHLIEQGYRDIGFVDYSGNGEDTHTQERIIGIEKAAENHGVGFSLHLDRIARADRPAAVQKFLDTQKNAQALIVNSLSAAQIFLQTAHQRKIRIPQDLAIASFDDGSHFNANTPYITSAIRPDFAFGRSTADMVLRRLEDPGKSLPLRSLDFELQIGGSTREEI
ncbi:LacI family DNA-binding transcriptional regulator [Kiritimatiellaeota bacterium B1221]|nr:LacI family DNA-binding transcriptional regulator [Kiritimatiellaeota bacterium B1221]